MKLALLNALLIGSGGFAGTVLRYALAGLVQRHFPLATFPYGTLFVNLLGCLMIGAFAGLADVRQLFAPEVRAFALIGVIGGFTTFSTFGYETFAMARDGEHLRAACNVGLHVIFGLTLVWWAYRLTGSR